MEFQDIEYALQVAIQEMDSYVRRHRLIIVTDCSSIPTAQIEEAGLTALNLNLKLSEALLNHPQSRRSRGITAAISTILNEYPPEKAVLITHFELLFLPELQQDPIRLFEDLSRERTLVLLWPGSYENGLLSYAQPWHSEYREFQSVDAQVI